MKRLVAAAICLLLLLSLCACGGEGETNENLSNGGSVDNSKADVKVELDIKAEVDAIIGKYSIEGGRRYTSNSTVEGEFLNEDLIRSYYGYGVNLPDFASVEAYEVYIDETKPIKPCEFGIFKMKDGADAEAFMSFIKARIDKKIETSKAYPSMDTEPLKTAIITEKGGYVWYAVVKGGNTDIDNTLKGKFE